MRLGLINSTWSQAGRALDWGIAKTREIGFDSIDLLVDPLELSVQDRCLIKRECDRQELPIVSLCCVAVGLIDPAQSVREFHLDRCRAHLDLVYEYQAENMLLVLGEYIWNREIIPPAEQWKQAVENCQMLAEYAGELGVKIALELEPFPLSLVNSVDTMLQFVRDVNHSALKANIDVSHLHLAHVPAEEILKLKGEAIHVHISDCDGKVHGDLPPGRGVVDFPPYLQKIREIEIPGSMSVELEFAPNPDQIEDWVREAYQQTARLMHAAGLRPLPDAVAS
jgi:sugar phosphate isomerase/epimerase